MMHNAGSLLAAAEPSLRESSRSAMDHVADALFHLVNESSEGLFHVQEHVFQKVPQLVADKKELAALTAQVSLAVSDISEAQELVAKMGRITTFRSAAHRLNELHTLLMAPAPSSAR